MLRDGPSASWPRMIFIALALSVTALPASLNARHLSDREIAERLDKHSNQIILDAFIKEELKELIAHTLKPLLESHPSLTFVAKQYKRKPLGQLRLVEKRMLKLRELQSKINHMPYSLAFSRQEKRKIMDLQDAVNKILSYGIPLVKRRLYRALRVCKNLADERGRHPNELMPHAKFRDAVLRKCEPDSRRLDRKVRELARGEFACMKVGWALEKVTVIRLWLLFDRTPLPRPEDYVVFREKCSKYWEKRLRRIYQFPNRYSRDARQRESQ